MSENTLLYDHYALIPEHIPYVLSKFGKQRDYYFDDKKLHGLFDTISPYIVLLHILAIASNKTLVSVPTLVSLNPTLRTSPSILPQIQTNDLTPRQLQYLWKLYRKNNSLHGTNQLPVFIQVVPTDMSFLYCRQPSNQLTKYFHFDDFTNNFDNFSWLAVIVSLLGIIMLVGKSHWLTVLSPVLTAGTNNLHLKCPLSGILVLWMLCSRVLCDMYSGCVTSTFIKPSKDYIFQNIVELQKNNFTLMFDSDQNLDHTKSSYQKLPENLLHPYFQTLVQMVNVAASMGNIFKVIENYHNFTINYATIQVWPIGLRAMATLNEKSIKSDSKKKRCHVGKELIPTGHWYFAFLPPDHEILARMFKNLIDTGVYNLWYQESVAIGHSKRVQNRVRVKGPTTTGLEDLENTTVKGLGLHGKIVKVFVLWSMCLLTSKMVAILEIISHKSESLTKFIPTWAGSILQNAMLYVKHYN